MTHCVHAAHAAKQIALKTDKPNYMILLITQRTEEDKRTETRIPVKCSIDKAKRLADDLYFMGTSVIDVWALDGEGAILYKASN